MKEFKGDKRTKEYKQWKANFEKQSAGLGDTVEKITTATGIKKAVKFLAGEDCGCDERKDKLNKIFPYQKPNCLTEIEYIYLKDNLNKNKITPDIQKELVNIYNRIFNEKAITTGCSKCFLNGVHKKLNDILNEYK
jgi:hypothetical protein